MKVKNQNNNDNEMSDIHLKVKNEGKINYEKKEEKEEKENHSCLYVFICYLIEICIYPFFVMFGFAIFSFYLAFMSFTIGIILFMLIFFSPFYLIMCCIGYEMKKKGIFLCQLSLLGCVLLLFAFLVLMFFPVNMVWKGMETLILIYEKKINPYNKVKKNFKVMFDFIFDYNDRFMKNLNKRMPKNKEVKK